MNELNLSQQHKRFRILLLGDSCIDEYQIGTVDRLSPEAPVPVVKIVDTYSVAGMAANVAANLAKFNVHVDFITNSEKVIKTRFMDSRSGQHLLRVDNETTLTSWQGSTPMSLHEYDAIVISDYNKGFLTYGRIADIINNVTCPVFIDTKKTDLAKFSAPNVYLKINDLEYRLAKSLPNNLIITLGSKGAIFKTTDSNVEFPTIAVDVVDVCGCGDTFLAAVSYWYLVTNDISEAIKFANKAASITVQHQGNYAPGLTQIIS